MIYLMDVSDYIAGKPSPQNEILQRLRQIILKNNPNIHEEIKMGVPWYEGKFYLVGFKDHVNMGFAYNKMLDKYQDQLKGKGQYMRHIKFRALSDINEKHLKVLMQAVQAGYINPHT